MENNEAIKREKYDMSEIVLRICFVLFVGITAFDLKGIPSPIVSFMWVYFSGFITAFVLLLLRK